jgi:SagB-type dehydrogenase family enzyme
LALPRRPAGALAGHTVSLRAPALSELPPDTVEQVIARRGSTRKFGHAPISFEELSTILHYTTRGLRADFLSSPDDQVNDLYIVANQVDGLAPGAYFYDRVLQALVPLKAGDFSHKVRYLGLEQALPGDASVAIFFLADLRAVIRVLGNRGYRIAQLEAGILGGRIYLASYALGLGATGLTFYDDDVVQFFSPHAKGKSAIFLMAVGKSQRSLTRE